MKDILPQAHTNAIEIKLRAERRLGELTNQRPIARSSGVSEATINRDLNVTPVTVEDDSQAQINELTVTNVIPIHLSSAIK